VKKRLHAFDAFQQRHPALALPLAVAKKFGDDRGSNLAALIAYRAFFSLFPLLLLMTTVLGYLLADDPSLRRSVVDSTLSQFPVIGEQLEVSSLQGSGAALAVGIAGTLWAGFGVVLAGEEAIDKAWEVPDTGRPGVLASRLRALGLLVALGGAMIVSTVASGIAGGGAGPLGAIAGLLVSVALNLAVFVAVFHLLGSVEKPVRASLPGAVLAAVCWTALQLVGGWFVSHEIRNATPVYGTFALVIGLLAWIQLGAMLTVFAAELNVVWARKLWPRSIAVSPTPSEGADSA
jgi:YihY family inner membrane protein